MSENKNLDYQEIYPDERLQPFVKHFWRTHNRGTDITYTVLPDGYFDLIVEMQEGSMVNITLFGLYTQQTDIHLLSGRTFLGIVFKPLAAEYILKSSISGILNGSRPLPKEFWAIDKISPDNFGDFIKITSEKIHSLLDNSKSIDKRKLNIFDLIYASKGSLHVQNLADQVFWTARQINRYCKDRLGLSLKAYNNIFRCSTAYTDLRAGKLYPQNEYFDQSHFIKEVKKHTGQNPSELHANKNDRILQFLTLPGQ
ncbi:DUF6597 domain-containing transcriptional factor [Flavitalea flava]